MKLPMRPTGYSLLREELQRLKGQRPELAQAIELARQHGDLSENADYDAAKNNSGMVEAKIRDIEMKLASAEIVDPRKISQRERVQFGLSVRLEDVDSGDEKVYTIVGSEESDVDRGWISFETPLARALMNKEEGDIAVVKLPGGKREYEVREIFLDYPAEG
jgi:transcription elongation factor GreA